MCWCGNVVVVVTGKVRYSNGPMEVVFVVVVVVIVVGCCDRGVVVIVMAVVALMFNYSIR